MLSRVIGSVVCLPLAGCATAALPRPSAPTPVQGPPVPAAGPAEQGPRSDPFPLAAGAWAGIGAGFVEDAPGQLADGGTALQFEFAPYLRLWRYLSVGIGGGGSYATYTSETVPPLDPATGTYTDRMNLKLIRLVGSVRGHLPIGWFEPFVEVGGGLSFGTLIAPVMTELDPGGSFTQIEQRSTAATAHIMAGFAIAVTRTVAIGTAWMYTWNQAFDFEELSGGEVDQDGHAALFTVDLRFELPRE